MEIVRHRMYDWVGELGRSVGKEDGLMRVGVRK